MICVVVNNSKHLRGEEVARVCAAITKWSHGVSLMWSVPTISVHRGSPAEAARASFGAITLQDGLDVPGALGYHEVVGGRPVGLVDVGACLESGLSWSVTLSHEVGEMMVDPWCLAAAQCTNDAWIAYELCDPVEDDRWGMQVDGVLCSNYLLPSYFGGQPPYDAMGLLQSPAPALLPGGYASIWRRGKWSQAVNHGEDRPARAVDSRRHALRVALSNPPVHTNFH